MRDRLRMLWWRVRTRARLLSSALRWRLNVDFHTLPELTAARYWANHPETRQLAFETFAAHYNSMVPGGYMTAVQAERIYRERHK